MLFAAAPFDPANPEWQTAYQIRHVYDKIEIEWFGCNAHHGASIVSDRASNELKGPVVTFNEIARNVHRLLSTDQIELRVRFIPPDWRFWTWYRSLFVALLLMGHLYVNPHGDQCSCWRKI